MSHFTVAIISDGKKPIEEYLEPFCECTENRQYLEFYNIEDEERKRYNTEKKTVVEIAKGVYKDIYDEMFFVPTDEQFYCANANSENIRVWRRFEGGQDLFFYSDYGKFPIVEKLACEVYSTFDEYMIANGYEKDESQNAFGYWYNPNAKWDWYVVGGRWKGLLKATKGEHGASSSIRPKANVAGHYDIAQIKDIDFSIDTDAYVSAIRFWEVCVEKQPLKSDENPASFHCYMKPEYYKEQFGTKERFARAQSELSTFAVITNDGKWHEQGQMGWFGVCDASGKQTQEWYDGWYNTFVKNVDPEWYITIVDCHI